MHKILKVSAGITLIVVLAAIASCTKVCDLGYEGDHCVTPVRNKYLGLFSGRETCGSATDTFSVAIIEVAGDVTKIKINNIYNSSLNAIGTVLSNGSITIASQGFGTGTINGNVTITGGKLNLSYTIAIPGNADANCTWVQD